MKKILFITALLLTAGISTQAQVSQWVAYNDHYRSNFTAANVSSWNILGTLNGAPGSSGQMTNFATGVPLTSVGPVTMSLTNVTNGVVGGTGAASPSPGSPASLMFSNIVDFGNGGLGHALQLATSAKIAHAFTGLDPSRLYSWHGTGVRGGGYSDRWTLLEIAAASFVNAHTVNTGTGVFTTVEIGGLAANQAVANFGENRLLGVVAGWTNIQPNADGSIVIYQSTYRGPMPGSFSSGGVYGYAVVADRLEEFTAGTITCVGITNESGNISVAERGLATFSISATGTPQNIQWFRSNNGGASYVAIGGAISSTYSIASVVVGDNGAKFYAAVTNTSCMVTSAVKTLTIIPDTVRPVGFRAVANSNLTTVTVSFSEALAPASVTVAAFQIYPAGSSPGANVDTATLTNGTNVIITTTTTPMVAGQNYSVRITGVTDTAGTPNLILPNPTTLAIQQPVIMFPFTKVWRYIDTGTNLGTAWKETAYDDSAWPSGSGVLGLETTAATLNFLTNIAPPTGTNTVLSLTNNIGAGLGGANGFTNVTFYFRTTVNISSFDPASATMTLRGYMDDGAALYVNGVERFRYNLPAGATNTSFATANLAEATLVVSNLTGFVQGNNVIAVEVHQDAIGSSDIDWGMQLEALVSSFIPLGPKLTNRLSGSTYTITWPGGGTLQKSTNISGTNNWVTIPGAASPFVTNTAPPNKYFRVTVP